MESRNQVVSLRDLLNLPMPIKCEDIAGIKQEFSADLNEFKFNNDRILEFAERKGTKEQIQESLSKEEDNLLKRIDSTELKRLVIKSCMKQLHKSFKANMYNKDGNFVFKKKSSFSILFYKPVYDETLWKDALDVEKSMKGSSQIIQCETLLRCMHVFGRRNLSKREEKYYTFISPQATLCVGASITLSTGEEKVVTAQRVALLDVGMNERGEKMFDVLLVDQFEEEKKVKISFFDMEFYGLRAYVFASQLVDIVPVEASYCGSSCKLRMKINIFPFNNIGILQKPNVDMKMLEELDNADLKRRLDEGDEKVIAAINSKKIKLS